MERKLAPIVVVMMVLSGIYAFDLYYDAAGITGHAINTASGNYDCSDADGNSPYVAGVTVSSFYAEGLRKDECVGNDLLEYYCTESGPDVRGVECRRGCFAGACG